MSRCACHNADRKRATIPFHRILNMNHAPELEYRRTRVNVRHAGQLKLMCSEIAFLNEFKGAKHTVVYAGAAPGTHIPCLVGMFPEMRFVLIDSQPSAVSDARCEIIQGLMTDGLASELVERLGNDILFISDVRVAPVGKGETDREHQTRIQRDMEAQMGWHNILNPTAAMFKFRLPWDLEPYTSYLQGDIHFPVFGRHLTHEARLVVKRGAALVSYDNGKYERQMAFFNRVQRVAIYDDGRCYDCTAFREIVGEYLGKPVCAPAVEETCLDIENKLNEQARQWHRKRQKSTLVDPVCEHRAKRVCAGFGRDRLEGGKGVR